VLQANTLSATPSVVATPCPDEPSWADEAQRETCEISNDWGLSTNDEHCLDELEAKLQELEAGGSEPVSSSPDAFTGTANSASWRIKSGRQSSSTSDDSFRCFELHPLREPLARRMEGTDEDDVGLSASGADNDKIQRMLARYMAEEEDEGILAALRGSATVDGGGTSHGKERDERLSAEDRALLSYTDRLKRSPRQVIRYAYGGVPLWSM
jgi:hypothetical protein